jgi:hypothetical protein
VALVVAGTGTAKERPKSPSASAISQYVEMVPSAGGAKPTSGRATPPAASKTTAGHSKSHKAPKPTKTKPVTAKPAARAVAANPVSAAFAPTGGGLSGGALLAIVLGSITAAGAGLFALRRRLSR